MDELKKRDEEGQRGGQEFYAGGNDSRTGGGSGLATMGPPSNSNDPFQKIVDNAKADSASQTGGGGEHMDPSDMIKLTLFRNGFTVDDGPLRDLESPENKAFLDQLTQGYVPPELVKERREKGLNGPVNVALNDKRDQDYRAPTPPPYVAFGGEGSSIGSVAKSGGALIDPSSSEFQEAPPVLDSSQPSTLLQVKLADGKKIKVKLNKSHKVHHLALMIRNRDGGAGSTDGPYYLCSGFPPKDIEDLTLTLIDAGLVGASISQRTA